MSSDDSTPGEPPPFDSEVDELILRGMVGDQTALFDQMRARGQSEERVRARAARLGLTGQILAACRLSGTVPSIRLCLACERQFLSAGPQHRLCGQCRRLS